MRKVNDTHGITIVADNSEYEKLLFVANYIESRLHVFKGMRIDKSAFTSLAMFRFNHDYPRYHQRDDFNIIYAEAKAEWKKLNE